MTFNELKEKYSVLNDKKKLLLFFLIQWLYWAVAWWGFKKVWPDDEPLTLPALIFFATWMACWMTLIFKWKTLRSLMGNKSK